MKSLSEILEKTIECGSDEGITLATIEGIIAQLRILYSRKLKSKQVRDALLDMKDNAPSIKALLRKSRVGQ